MEPCQVRLAEGESLDDLLLDGYKIIQHEKYYRFTSDSVLLSRFARAKRCDVVADFCAGSGIVGLHFFLLHRKAVRSVDLFEMQSALSDMSRRTVAYNGLKDFFRCYAMRIQDIPKEFAGKYSLILCNPPYERGGFEKQEEQIAMCRKELYLTLNELVGKASSCLQFGGRFCLCHRADRTAEAICALHGAGIEPKRLQFVCGKVGAKPYLVLLEGVRGGKAGIEILPSLVNEK